MESLFSMQNINKSFGKVKVLKDVQLEVKKGEIHALVGENGAGKSTLMNILGGAIPKDSGEIIFEGKEIDNMSPDLAKELGIGFVQQELNLAESVSVAENVYIGRLPCKNKKLGIIDYDKLYEDTQELINLLGASFKPTDIVEKLSTANKQLVEIAKAISLNAKAIIFDEPTTSLSDHDVEILFIVINALKDKGISSIYITHRMDEIHELCDRLTVLRDGQYISTDYVENLTTEDIIKQLVGRDLDDLYRKEETDVGDINIEAIDLKDKYGKVKSVTFNAREGEIVGFSGLIGSGRTETMRLLFGADKLQEGTVKVNGNPVEINSPKDAINNGLSLLTEDRKNQGLALNLSIKDNINLAAFNDFIINRNKIEENANNLIQNLNIKISDKNNPVFNLSGGNQQKVVLAKWLNTNSDIYIFDEPTKGIDVGAKSEIYKIITNLAKDKKTILVVSSDMTELLGICDRIYVFSEGKITGELKAKEATQEKIMKYATVGVN